MDSEYYTSPIPKIISIVYIGFYVAAALTVTVPWVAIGLWVLAVLSFLSLVVLAVLTAQEEGSTDG